MEDQQVTPDPRAISEALAERLLGWSKPSTRGRCDVCGWPVHEVVELGCTPDSCSQRPPPEHRADKPPDLATTGEGMLRVWDAILARKFYCKTFSRDEPVSISVESDEWKTIVQIRCWRCLALVAEATVSDFSKSRATIEAVARAALSALDREGEA